MDQKKLSDFEKLTELSALATELTVQFDDVIEKLEDSGLKETLRLKEEELQKCEKTLRKIMDRAFDQKNDLRGQILDSFSVHGKASGPCTVVDSAAADTLPPPEDTSEQT